MNDVTPIRTAAETGLLDLFPAVQEKLPGDARIKGARERAIASFAATGLPHRRVEAWKYTDLRALMREAPPLAAMPDAAALRTLSDMRDPLADIDAIRIAIVDGYLDPGLSDLNRLPPGVEAFGLAGALADGHPLLRAYLGAAITVEDPMLALNAAFMTDGIVLRIAAGTTVERPIALRLLRSGTVPAASFVRVLVVVEAGARLTLAESHEAPDGVGHHAYTVMEVVAGDGAQVDHVRLAPRGTHVLDLSSLAVTLGRDSVLRTFNLALAAWVSRHQLFVSYAGPHATATIAGASLLNGRQHADSTLLIDHAQPYGQSREIFRSVLDGDSTGVFQGKIIVRPHAQKTDGRMMSQAVLLGEGASMNNKPELEIFADDVQCAHGATCGALDEELLFYLRARGLPPPEAEALLLQAFVGEALDTVEHEGLRGVLADAVAAWLRARM